MGVNTGFHWECHSDAHKFLIDILQECYSANPVIYHLNESFLERTSSSLFYWVDHFVVDFAASIERDLEKCGFEQEAATSAYRVFTHPTARLPSVVVRDEYEQPTAGVTLKVDNISDFLMSHNVTANIEGIPLSEYRRSCVSEENGVSLWVVERRGTRSMEPSHHEPSYILDYLKGIEKWQSRPRDRSDDSEALHITIELAEQIISVVGLDTAAWMVLDCERKYWQSRNTAGQLQFSRQNSQGLGWANHLCHVFRSSRKHFTMFVRLFETLGFHCREKIYAGAEAGWGAQVMENSNAGLEVLLEVDLIPGEIDTAFSHHPLPELEPLGPIGLWCALHGESLLQAGMHRQVAWISNEKVWKNSHKTGICMLEPLHESERFKQGWTKGEIWGVDPKRVQVLVQNAHISSPQAEEFLGNGVIGSHLEILECKEGYKGFDKNSLGAFIKQTNPLMQKTNAL
ncbi:MAG: hypothetical protein ACI9S8_000970 [Chlamydiales bacterium]|jgi:hypothetical protein